MKLLVIRFSAMGDVALLAPVVHRLLEANPNLEMTVLTKRPHDALFYGHERLKVKVIAHQTNHRGLIGLWRLTRWISNQDFDYVVDVHDNLRSRVIAILGRLLSVYTIRFKKGRNEKQALVKNGYRKGQPFLKHSTDRYLDVFLTLGLAPGHSYRPIPQPKPSSQDTGHQIESLLNKGQRFNIGIAPFAAHPSKAYPVEQLLETAKKIEHLLNVQFIIFGGPHERTAMDNLRNLLGNAICVPNHFSLSDELCIIGHLDLMIAMDSANMHMASILGRQVVSIWGPTHPALGFGPLFNENGIVQAVLPCRPCSIFGRIKTRQQSECAEKAFQLIHPEAIAERVVKLLNKK